MMKKIMLSLAAAAVLSGTAFAEPTVVTKRHTTVAYGDLNLDSEAGVAVLYERLRVASKEVCGATPGVGDNQFNIAAYDSCTSGAVSRAVSDLGDKIPAAYRK